MHGGRGEEDEGGGNLIWNARPPNRAPAATTNFPDSEARYFMGLGARALAARSGVGSVLLLVSVWSTNLGMDRGGDVATGLHGRVREPCNSEELCGWWLKP